MKAEQIISTHPDVRGNVNQLLVRCVEKCFECARTCLSCADACLAEPDVQHLRQCIRLNLDCEDLCVAAGALSSRRTGSNETILKATLEVCAQACRDCADECERHAKEHKHCEICAEACRSCFQACEAALPTIGTGSMNH